MAHCKIQKLVAIRSHETNNINSITQGRPELCNPIQESLSHMWLLSTWNVAGLNWNMLNIKYILDYEALPQKKNVKYLSNFYTDYMLKW